VVAVAGRSESAAAKEPGGGPLGPVDVSWLILERLSDLKEQIGDLKDQISGLRREQEKLDAKIDSVAEKLDAKIDSVAEKLDAKIDNLRNYIVIPVVLVLLAAILAHFAPGL
jgi:seryl-tRNA synthetase